MKRDREQLREDLIAVLAAGRELDPADDVHLADVFLDEMEATERRRTRKPRAPGFLVLLLAGAVGLGTMASYGGLRSAAPSPRPAPNMTTHGGMHGGTALMLRVGN